MSLLLAPYNDSMRVGMGFNSYTQSLCIDNAVEIAADSLRPTENPSQNVTYSSKFVEHLSEVVSSMQISHSTSIKKGTVEVAGNGDSINEDKIKSSDINAVISVKVVNQTIVSGDNAIFRPLPGVFPGTQQFNDNFGDCYISGFVTGGEFNGVISMRVVDRSKTDSVVSSIKKSSRSGKGADFLFDMDQASSSFLDSSTLKDTETTITVSWMGGGQIKEANTAWTLDSVYAAADAFPARVAKKPQRTWAILTKYKSNRSFVYQTRKMTFSPLEYDLVATFTSTLFDNYMDYKSLIKYVQDIMANPERYKVVKIGDGIPIDVNTLVAVRSAFRAEMSKIVQAVDILTRDPQVLKKAGQLSGAASANATVLAIIKASTAGKVDLKDVESFWSWQDADAAAEKPPVVMEWPTIAERKAETSTLSPSHGGKVYYEQWVWVDAEPVPYATKTSRQRLRPAGWYDAWIETGQRMYDLDRQPNGVDRNAGRWGRSFINRFENSTSADGSWQIGLVDATVRKPPGSVTATEEQRDASIVSDVDRAIAAKPITDGTTLAAKASITSPTTKGKDKPSINFDLLISPETWKDLLPRAIDESPMPTGAEAGKLPISLLGKFPDPPANDLADRGTKATKVQLQILCAVCGVIDCTDFVRELIKPDQSLVIDTSKFLAEYGNKQPSGLDKVFLTFIYQYTGQPKRICNTGMIDVSQSISINQESTISPILEPAPYNLDTWSVSAIVYGGQLFLDTISTNAVLSEIKANYGIGKGQRRVMVNSTLIGKVSVYAVCVTSDKQQDPLKGLKKSSVIFYQSRKDGQMRATAGIDNDVPCVMTESLAAVSDAQVQASQQAKIDLSSKDGRISELQKEAVETKKLLDKANSDLIAANKGLTDKLTQLTKSEETAIQRQTTIDGKITEINELKTKLASAQKESTEAINREQATKIRLDQLEQRSKTLIRYNPNAERTEYNLDTFWHNKWVNLICFPAMNAAVAGQLLDGPWTVNDPVPSGYQELKLGLKCILHVQLEMAEPNNPKAGWFLKTDSGSEYRSNTLQHPKV